MADRAWLAELKAKWGESRIDQPPVRLHDDGGPYDRECWAWFPHDGQNHNLAIDRYADSAGPRWRIRAASCSANVAATIYGPGVLPDATIRQVLVLAGMLDG
jgi:hypothetical protein